MKTDANPLPHLTLNLSLQGRTALVCGASSGLGRASAQALAGLGARIIALARSEEKLREVVAALPGTGHVALALDVNDHAALVSRITALGPIEILINNSGGPKAGPIVEARPEQFVEGFHQLVLTSHALVQTLLPGMKSSGYGRIINIVGTSVKTPLPGLGVSNTIRAATAAWAKTMAGELGPFGITVNCVLPGQIRTDRLNSLIGNAAKERDRSAVEKEWESTIPLRRFGEPHELGDVVAFLASPAGSYVSGVALPIDGGKTPSL